MKNEPFGTYTLNMAKADSAAAIREYRKRKDKITSNSLNGLTIVSMAYLIGWVALSSNSIAV